MIINGVILGVGSQSGTSSKTGKPYTRFDINFSDGKTYTTFEPEISSTASTLQGQPVSMDVSVVQNGNFTNYYVNRVGLEGSLGEATENTQQNNILQNNSAEMVPADEKKRSKEQIARESALIAAFSCPVPISETNIYERMELAKRIYRAAVNDFDPDQSQTPEEVATTVPGVETGANRDW